MSGIATLQSFEYGVVAEVDVGVGAQVGVDHGRVVHHRLGLAFGHDLAFGHHGDPVGDMAHHVDVVFHEQHRGAVFAQRDDVIEQALLQRRVHAGHRLVEHDELRVAHERTGHFEELALAAGERPGVVVLLLVEQEAVEQGLGLLAVLLLLLLPRPREQRPEHALAGVALRAQHHVVEYGEPAHHLGELEGAHHAAAGHFLRVHMGHVLAVELPGAGVRGVEAGHEVEERRLAGAVRADEGRDAMTFDLEMPHIHGRHATEATGDVVSHQNRVGLVHAGLVLHVAQVFGHLVAVGGGDELLPLRRLRSPFRDVVERFLHGGRRAGGRGLACLVGCVSH
ncbi:Hypothetical membrane associated protein [Bifidobacterium animalis subsp. lactis CNCM I-2494]|uniref:Hypothetical membrane associated protein n=1 Tax=Bifidobacterium animalis subsp. lactis CNCM I-2494 TaxID=1042403 RepID=A0A806FP41_BIFAN|nr:Hypothetical membrane associated protein [Bifidobacterium animalis subsp. lactis CNCM I-2494]